MKSVMISTLVLAAIAATPAMAGKAENTVTWGFDSQLETMNPYATNKGSAQLVMRNVLEHLLYRNSAGEARPALATSWKWVDDKTIDFELRKGVTFSNGEAFNADDVVYTMNFIKNPESKISAQADYGFIDNIEKTGEYSLRMHLTKPTPSAIDRLSQTLFILPDQTHPKMDAAEFGRAPVGTGPYKVKSFEAGQQVTLVRNETYYDADWGKPRFDGMTVLSITDPQTRIAELTSGRVDFLWNVTPDQVLELQLSEGIKTVTGSSTVVTFLSLDPTGRVGPNPAQDINVRKAMIHAIDREGIAAVLQGGDSVALNAPCHPRQFGCIQEVTKYEYNVDKAKEYLAKSGFPDGFETSIAAFVENARIAEAVVGNLHDIGIRATVNQQETSAWVKDYFAGKISMGVVPWPSNGVYDVSAITPFFFQEGKGDYVRDKEINDWFAEAASTIDKDKRLELYTKGFSKMADQVLNIPLVTRIVNYGYRDGLDFQPPSDGYPLMYLMGWAK